jgi:2-methylcitrate dehydratase PrpD
LRGSELVDWFGAALQAPPSRALGQVDLLVLDFIGNSVAGSTSELGAAVRRQVAATAAPGRGQVLGSTDAVAPGAAAMANATMVSAFDFDEGYHVAGYTIASSLATAQSVAADGELFRRVVAAAYETGENLRRAADAERDNGGGITNSGWYHVGVVGPLVAALCAGTLLGLTRAQLSNALGIATNSCGGVRANFGRGAKQLQPGLAARAGVEAAQLAALGVTGSDDAIAGELGMASAFAAGSRWDWGYFDRWSWERSSLVGDLAIRRYPAVGPAQPAVEALLRLRAEYRFTASDVERIEAKPRPFSLRTPAASNESELGFSLPYVLAAATVDGELGISQLRFDHARRPELRDLMSKVVDRTDGVAGIVVRLTDGRRLERAEGDISYLTSPAEITTKFRTALGSDERAAQITGWLDRLPETAVSAVPGAGPAVAIDEEDR